MAIGLIALAACGSSKKATGTTATTASGGGVTVPSGSSGNTFSATLGDTQGTAAPMTLVFASSTGKAGDVTFTVKNGGTIDHEMIILKTDSAFDQLPVVDAGDPPAAVSSGADKVDEANNVGETGDPNLKAGESRTFTVKGLTAGKYVAVCNLAKHYGLGMRAAFTLS